MIRPLEVVCSLGALARLGLVTGFRFRGRWWRWRIHTAFGSHAPGRPPLRAVFEFGKWVAHTRRMM